MKKAGVSKLAKKVAVTVLTASLSLSVGCGTAENKKISASEQVGSSTVILPEPSWDTVKEGKLIGRPVSESDAKKELLEDLNFSRGFGVTLFHANTSNGKLSGELDYGGDKADGEYCWKMAQWGCRKDMVREGDFSRNGSVITYDDGGKYISVDANKTGCISLGIKGSEEYTPDDEGNPRERTDSSENWPHILIEQTIDHAISPDCKALYMEIEYCVEECVSLVDREVYPVDPNLNAAQFQWFLTLHDNDENSVSYGQAMWFGFSMFDTRALGGTPDGMSAYDGGKEDSTGLFIYMPSLNSVVKSETSSVNSLPSSVVGKKVAVKFDILPFLKQALKLANQSGALLGAKVSSLKIGSTNIGWELPGNYDVKVDISYMNLYETF